MQSKKTSRDFRCFLGVEARKHRDHTELAEYLNGWLDAREELEQIRPSTAADYRHTIRKHIVPDVGRIRLSEINPATLDSFYRRLVAVECSSRNRLKVHSVLRKSFNDAVKRGLLVFNPCQRVDAPKHETKEGRAFTPDQMRTFLKEATTDRLHPLYVLAISTGCRQGELFELRWSDIDFEARELHITRTLVDVHGKLVVGPPKSKKGVRTIRLSAVALEALQAQRTRLMLEGLAGCELVFPDCKGGWLRRQNVLRRSYRPILKRSGLIRSSGFTI